MQGANENQPLVGIVTMATGRYVEFVPQLIASARQHVRGLGPVFVLTDADHIDAEGDVRLLPWPRMEWPLPTLLRYRAFTQFAEQLSTIDILLYSDADMLFVGEVDVCDATGLIAVRHPGYTQTRVQDLPYERRSRSAAAVARGAGLAYFCGGLQGGLSKRYLSTAKAIASNIDADTAAGITAKWHDESHWNCHLVAHPPELQLDSNYCTPDTSRTADSRVLALTKDHAQYRELKGIAKLHTHLMQLRHALASRLHGRRHVKQKSGRGL